MKIQGRVYRIAYLGIALLMVLLAGCSKGNTGAAGGTVSDNAGTPVSDKEITLNITEETVDVEELHDEFKILFLADSHISLCDDRDPGLSFRALERSVMYRTDDLEAWDRFDALMDEANKGDYDLILLGGDIIDSAMYASIDYLKDRLEKLDKPYVYLLGNHDFEYGDEYFSEKSYKEYLPRLKELRDGTPYQIREYENITVFTVDDNNNQIAKEALDAYKEEAAKGKPMVVALHVPLEPATGSKQFLKRCEEVYGEYGVSQDGHSTLFIGENGIRPNNITKEFMESVLSEDSPVVLVLAGHIHFYYKEMLNDRIVQIVTDPAFSGGAISVKLM